MSDKIKDLLIDTFNGEACHKWDHNRVWKGVKINSTFCTNVCKYYKNCEILKDINK
jgi:hypothetical protein